MALLGFTGFEDGITSPTGATDTGTTFDTTIVEYGTRSLKCASAASQAYRQITLPATQRVSVWRTRFRLSATPTTTAFFILRANAGVNLTIAVNTSGDLYAQVQGGSTVKLVGGVSYGAWHTLEVRFTVAAGAGTGLNTIDWKIDGTAQTQASFSTTLGDIASVNVGSTATTATCTAWYDRVAWWDTSSDYGASGAAGDDYKVLGLVPSASGTHNITTAGDFKDDAAANVTTGETTSWAKVDENPQTSTADYVAQTAGTSSEYLEYQLADTAEVWLPLAVRASAVWAAATAASCHSKLVAVDGASTTTIFDTTTSSTALVSQAAVMTARPATGAWTIATVNSLKLRWGFSTDLAPNPRLHAALIEVMYSLVTTDAGGSGPPPPTNGLAGLPSTTDGKAHLACWFNQYTTPLRNAANPTASAQEFAAACDLIITNGGTNGGNGKLDPYADTMMAANADLKLLLYEKSVQTKTSTWPEAAYAHKADGTRLYNSQYSVYIFQPDSVALIAGSVGPYAYIPAQVTADLQAANDLYAATDPYVGAGLDSMGPYTYNLGPPCKPGTTTVYTHDEWYTLVWRMGAKIKAARANTTVLGNGTVQAGGSGDSGTVPAQLLGNVDIILNEGWVQQNGQTPARLASDARWQQHVNMAISAQKIAVAQHCLTELLPTENIAHSRRYGFASCLIAERGGCFFELFAGETLDSASVAPWDSKWYAATIFAQTNLGVPSATYDTALAYKVASASDGSGNLYMRLFAQGVVLVNTSTQPITWTPDGRYYSDVEASNPPTVNTITVPARDAFIGTTSAITAGAPVNLVAPVISGIPSVGQTLTVNDGSWSGATSYARQWEHFTGGSWVAITGQTGSSYLIGAGDVGDAIHCVVTATNATGSTSATSNQTANVTTASTDYSYRILPTLPGPGLAYFGEQTNPYTRTEVMAREALLSRTIRVSVHDYDVTPPTSLPDVQWDFLNARLPLIRGLGQTGGEAFPGYAAINAGTYDTQITGWARLLKALGQPVLFEPWRAPNDATLPWTTATAADYTSAYQRVVNIFKTEDAGNVSFVFSPLVTTSLITTFYPGNTYVDWIGAYGYTSAPATNSLATIFSSWHTTYSSATTYGKPLLISGTGSLEAAAGEKATWFTNIPGNLTATLTSVDLVVFDQSTTYDSDSTSGATTAYLAMSGNPVFAFPAVSVPAVEAGEWWDSVVPVDPVGTLPPRYPATTLFPGAAVYPSQGSQPDVRILVDATIDPGPEASDPVNPDIYAKPAHYRDITTRIRELATTPGRQYEYDQFQARQGTLIVSNLDGAFDPDDPFITPRNTVTTNVSLTTTANVASTPSSAITSTVTPAADIQATGTLHLTLTPTGAVMAAGVAFRSVSASDEARLYVAFDTSGNAGIQIDQVVAGTVTSLWLDATKLLSVGTGDVHYRFAANDTTLRARIWTGLDEPTEWTAEVTGYTAQVAAGSARLIASHPSGVTNAPTATFTTNTISPYSRIRPKPMRRCRILMQWGGATRSVYTGYVDRASPAWPIQTDDTVVLELVDGMEPFAQAMYTAHAVPDEDSGSRAARVSRQIGLDTNTQAGQSVLTGGDIDTQAIAYIQTVADSENGQFYIDRNGRATFRSRWHRLLNEKASRATYTQNEYTAATPELARDLIINEARVITQDPNDAPQIATDPVSITRYYRRTSEVTTLVADSGERIAAASWLVRIYSEPQLRYASVSFVASTSSWTRLVQLDVGHRITLQHTTPHGATYLRDYHVEGLADHVTPGQPTIWEREVRLSPADASNYWVLGDPVLSVLGVTTRPAY